MTEPINNENKGRKLTGVVVSDKMKKTVVVAIDRLRRHPKYKKYYKITKRFKAHDENNIYRLGNKVIIQETKPMSKDKRWVVVGKV
ncbi:MAG: 30S ribosomal protein S17 [Candidatus Yanofskybacteria bacterium RIFCSPHIGHO2_02_FULL_43_15c]|uniref:Small ribosomal subunit protein uS17 n=2 Tax=Candidatus Yanofskyibacteriota TaxID=1752733 RepID=A0A1F8H1K4_9BACT|nr:MAG: 30S ribosomal protein S17 [Candidatus Yanofskybacteria bacterium RIFCSPHIGHO2_02_FULL_43_15c]OGN30756.1 MAG: 30S ribosomal protein S17 [Candidatus Yanofskybacteria bacterium RIFCSPLOWO2_02_FULL_43_10b]